jgi:hypothetical protein
MKYIKYFKIYSDKIFETINTDKFLDDSKEDLETLKDLLKDLSYFESSISTVSCRDTNESGSIIFYNAMVDRIKTYERTFLYSKSFRGLVPFKEIDEIIITNLVLEDRSKFEWEDIEVSISEIVNYMTANAWRYILEPVWDGNSMSYSLSDMYIFSYSGHKKLTGFSMVFYNSKDI